MCDERRLVIEFVVCIKVIDRIHDGVVALSAPSDDVDGIGVLQAMLGDDVLRLLDQVAGVSTRIPSKHPAAQNFSSV